MVSEEERIRVQFGGLSAIVGTEDISLVVVVDMDGKRQLAIPCDKHMTYQLQLRNEKFKYTKMLAPEAMWVMLQEFTEAGFYYIYINNFVDGHYTALLVEPAFDRARPIRPSDGILISVVTGIPLYVDKKVWRNQSSPYSMRSNQMSLPINVISDRMLERALDEAIRKEDYETASHVRDELNIRKKRQVGAADAPSGNADAGSGGGFSFFRGEDEDEDVDGIPGMPGLSGKSDDLMSEDDDEEEMPF